MPLPTLRLNPARAVSADSLNVAPMLVGHPLASPARRLAAMAIDLAVIGIASNVANAWLLAAIALVAWHVWRSRREATATRPRWLTPVVVALLLLGAVDAWRHRISPPEPDRSGAPQVAQRVAQQAAPALDTAASGLHAAASAPDVGVALAEAGKDAALDALAQQVESLEAEVRRLRGAPPDWKARAAAWLDALGFGYGGALLYFTLVPLWWPGQTVGKRLLGLRVVELTGAPVTVSTTFKRFGGYIAGLATGGIGLAQTIWDPNGQGLQDRAARTLVLDDRQASRASSIASP